MLFCEFRRTLFIVAIASASLLMALPGASASLKIADQGKAMQPIIIAQGASQDIKDAAEELQTYLNRITGGAFEIKAGDGASGIVLGTLEQFPVAELREPLEMRGPYDGREAYAIRTEQNRVLLLGQTDLGASHAANRFLHTLGVRWFFPSEEWEVVPKLSSITYDENEASRPAILSRRMFMNYGSPDSHSVWRNLKGNQDYAAWKRRNMMAQSINANVGHIWRNIYLDNKEEFDKHPEYWALIEDKDGNMVRGGPKFELANPAVRKIVTDYALKQLADNPTRDVANIDPTDGGGWSQSPESKALGSLSDQLYGLANEVAVAVQKEYPGKLVGLLAYNYHIDPPSFELEPNVYIELTAGFINGKLTLEQLKQEWPKKCENMGYYEYFSFWPWDQDKFPGGKANDLEYLRKVIPDYAKRNAMSLTAEAAGNWGLHGRGYYVANRLMWDPQADVPAILNDFYTKAFGNAASPMQRYYERMDKGRNPLVTDSLFAAAYRDLQEATELAQGDDAVQARLDHIKQYLHYNSLRSRMDRLDRKDPQQQALRKELALETLTFLYRTRWSYMNHWGAVWSAYTAALAKEFDEPSWSFKWEMVAPAERDAHRQPWRVEEPWTQAETQAVFEEGLKHFKPLDVDEKKFSDDLVPVAFDDPNPRPTKNSLMSPARYMFFSENGEPFEVKVTPGFIVHNRNRPAPPYLVKNAQGEVVASGPLPLDGEPRDLTIEVPGPGRYVFEYGTGAGQNFLMQPGQHTTLIIESYNMASHASQPPQYFYVPKGTKKIQYYWEGSPPPHQIMDPDGNLVREVKAYREIVTIPVPEGQDGKPWRLGDKWSAFFILHFYNVPNYFAATPSDLMVPREVAEKDGLIILSPQHQPTQKPQ